MNVMICILGRLGQFNVFVVYIVVIKLILNLGVKLILLSKVGFEEYKNSFKSIKKKSLFITLDKIISD